jgi:glycosyltransferase involved in cell wall biosynthesis
VTGGRCKPGAGRRIAARFVLDARAAVVHRYGMPSGLPRVVIDLEKLRHINCGLGRFALHLAEEMLRLAPGRFRPVFFLPAGAEVHLPADGFERMPVAFWKKEHLARLVRPVVRPFLPPPDVDLWHVTNQTSKYLPLDPRIPVVLTIHDLTFLHEAPREGREREIGRKLAAIRRKAHRAAAIVTDSQWVADDIRRHVALDGRPVHVVPLGIAPPSPVAASRPAYVPEGRFLLSIGNSLPHKNFHVLLDLLERLPDERLVIAGKKQTPYGGFLEREVARRGLTGRVVMPGEVSDPDRQWLYEHCEAFLFPSLTEGFGLPVLEAMQCGRPVFVSRATSLPEIAGEHGFYFDCYDAAAMAAVLADGLHRFRADRDAAERLKRHAAGFSWAAMAEGYARVYEEVIRGR